MKPKIKLKPKIKEMITPFYIDNKVIFGAQGTNIEIDDYDGEIFKLIKLFDGDNEIDKIYSKTSLNSECVNELIDILNENLLIENAELDMDLLSNREKERYKTNLNYFQNYSSLNISKYEYQKNLNNSTVAIIGVGGASLLATSLASMGVGKLILVDYDFIELSNLSRQIPYFESDIGKNKVDVAKEKINSINSSIEIEIYNKKITCSSEIDEIVSRADLVVNGIDTPPIESARWVNYSCMKNNKTMIQGGIALDTIIVEKYSKSTGCYDCFLIDSLRNDHQFEEELNFVYSKEFRDINTAYSPNIIMLTGLLSSEIGKELGRYGKTIDLDYTMSFNTKTFELKYINKRVKNPKCPTCSEVNSEVKEPISITKLVELTKGLI